MSFIKFKSLKIKKSRTKFKKQEIKRNNSLKQSHTIYSSQKRTVTRLFNHILSSITRLKDSRTKNTKNLGRNSAISKDFFKKRTILTPTISPNNR